MGFEVLSIYRPQTALPRRADAAYREVLPPASLRPFIRCFWGTDCVGEPPAQGVGGLVIPDTCMDLILRLDPGTGALSARFYGLEDTPRTALGGVGRVMITFGVRFYFWAAPLFMAEPPHSALGLGAPAERYFPGLARELAPLLEKPQSLAARARAAEGALLRRLAPDRADAAVLGALYEALRHGGNLPVEELARGAALSRRQLERRFAACMGTGPKRLLRLIRYQSLWQAMLAAPRFDVHDAVLRFGYSDQAHLLREFRAFHSVSPAQALRLAGRPCAAGGEPPGAACRIFSIPFVKLGVY